YKFHEEDTLFYNPILYIKSLTFTDIAFKDLNDLKDIYNLVILLNSDRIILP
ncbi:hypothetical protein QBC46DRAFT_263049, partial [Diplogelasinospora grovesii]